jgi:hypothetical protein
MPTFPHNNDYRKGRRAASQTSKRESKDVEIASKDVEIASKDSATC